ncbi:MAG TPA: ProQ/FinO family protein [Thauera sp.]|uniref:ProQ/FinO family protein n=1 Tax=Thauera sp. TaxID=1905334 RepID=UPI002B757E69|nr:ProQ/FinO family protein [Thauera sp.]HRP25558.1 ProQ/FinO family protein [Thauera sp.]HRP67459.1 ProQ/FinO family protein [Thauera sp.]
MTAEHASTSTAAPGAAPSVEPAKPAPRLEPRAMLKRLEAECPVFRDCKPLALKIDNSIIERFPDFERKTLRIALRMHTASTRYLKAVERNAQRFDLDGNPVGEVTEEQRVHASTTLKERFAAAAKQQREKREAEEAERRKQEKLQQLVSRFGR